MSVSQLEKEKEKEMGSNVINPSDPSSYGCQILLENTTLEMVKDSSFPSDAYLIWYDVEGETRMDLCRTSKRVNLFDLYYDKYGPGSVKKIDFGYGRTNPKLWGYKSSDKKKRK